MTKFTTYRIATKWLHNNYILANDINKEETFWDECRFNLYDENDNFIDIYQFFLTDASLDDVEFLEKTFGLKFSYSNNLDLFVLCVDHFGTSWDYVHCEILDNEILKYSPEIEWDINKEPPHFETTRKIIKR